VGLTAFDLFEGYFVVLPHQAYSLLLVAAITNLQQQQQQQQQHVLDSAKQKAVNERVEAIISSLTR